jgi:hypothetical protein
VEVGREGHAEMKRLLVWALWAVLALVLLAAGTIGWIEYRRPRLPPPPTAARMAELRAERDALQTRVRDAMVKRGEKSVVDAPRAGLMIGIPTSFTASILEQVVTGLFGETTLTLRNLKVHKEGDVKAKMLIRKKRLGAYVLDVNIHEVQGILQPGKPTLRFARNRVEVTLPVHLAHGAGNAELHFKWDSKAMAAKVACGDVDVTKAVDGGVIPEDYVVKGQFLIASAGDAILLTPSFPDLAVRIYVDPSESAWAVVDEVVKARRKGCEIALNKVDIKDKLAGILTRGFNVKIPQKIFKPIALPAGVSQSLEVQGIQLALKVKPTGILVARERIWYGADVNLAASRDGKSKPAAKTAAPGAKVEPTRP